ncbi:putative uncharacterized protein DDB_G0282133 isoform X2 [Mya arenaria]|uniref:putative uncharacterized protein DDB_G0282133 isoform X2 n=1 Tax=Mya arenaria TaxID=6604 RepID=UPI0022E32CE0|nr:putative uncharacterized protein DDB_G0282133 isoform X2 [Mya arenaria]
MYRIRRLGTPQMLGYTRSKSEERVRVNNQIAVSVDSHRLKGMGVGKIYSDYPYHPPPTAPEQNPHHVRPIATPSSSMLANSTFSRSSAHSISQTSPLSNYQTASPSRPERAVLKSAQNTSVNNQMNNLYLQKQNTEVKFDFRKHRSKISETSYSQNPILFGDGQEYFYSKGQGYLQRSENTTQDYSAYQNIRTHPSVQEEPNLNSSSTPTVPYSTADILYGNEVNGAGRSSSNDDPRQNSFGELERGKSKSRDLDNPNNRRPNSRNGKQKAISIDTVTPFDKDREDPLKSLSASLPPAKPSHHYRPNGIRSGNKGEQLFSSAKQNGAVNGREQDDLVAMGTLWSPNNGNGSGSLPPATSQSQQSGYKSGPVSNSNMNSYPSKVAPSSSGVNSSLSSSNNTLNSQRKYPTGNSMRPIVLQNNVSGRKTSNAQKEQEDPKYTDPMLGAPASFQQRIIELGALEGDTVRWERTKRLKKKKQDRDS